MASTWRRLYGAASGRWALMEGGEGCVAPPSLPVTVGGYGSTETLVYLGDPFDVIVTVHQRLSKSQHATIELARLLGVQEGSVRRYLAAKQRPTLPDAGWSALVRTYIGA